MSSIVSCPSCTTPLKVKSWQIGEEMPCPGCGRMILVPEPASIDGDSASDSSQWNLPPRKKKKTRPNQSASGVEKSTADRGTSTSPVPRINSKLLATGVAVMICGIAVGLLVWSFVLHGDNDAPDVTSVSDRDNEPGPQDDTDDIPRVIRPDAPDGDEEGASTGGESNSSESSGSSGKHSENIADKGRRAAGTDGEAESDGPETSPAKQKRSPAETIAFLKAATAFVKVASTEGTQSGSGFLLEMSNGAGLVVTNAHVIEPQEGTFKHVHCVFHSGMKNELTVAAKVVGVDEAADLAVLEVTHKDLPPALDPPEFVQLYETLPVLVLGFPFGEALTAKKEGNPAITVSKGTVSSIRRNEHDRVAVVQIDGGINMGNSGGPVVTEEGRLLGVSVAKVRGTEIGMAIPVRILRDTLRGRAVAVQMARTGQRGDRIVYRSSVKLVDPKRNIRSARILTCPSDDVRGKQPDRDGRWQKAAENMRETALTIRDSTATATVEIPVTAAGSAFQIAWTLKDGTEILTAPIELRRVAGDKLASIEPDLDEIVEAPVEKQGSRVMHLPAAMSDFAINPKTGDVAAVDATNHRAHLLSADRISGNNGQAEFPSMQVGDTPVAIAHKQFGDRGFFAVVCTRDSHLYLIDDESFALERRIPLTGAGVSCVACSQNPKDPFIYYSFGSGHSSAAGAIDLRSMTDCGQVFADAMDCAISADGRMAYRRGPWMPSGFESLMMVSEPDATRPTFVPLHDEHRAALPYCPDPFGDYTASGRDVFSRSLEERIGSLNFVPAAFFRNRPILVGLDGLQIRAASYNTLKSVGHAVRLPNAVGGIAQKLPRGVNAEKDFKVVEQKQRLLADDAHERVIFGFKDRLAIVPLDVFRVPDEPFLAIDVDRTQLTVGREEKIAIRPRDPRVRIHYDQLPLGARKTDTGIEWTPGDADVGTETVSVTLSFADIEKTRDLLFSVAQPFLGAPFDVAGFSLSEDGSRLLCWTGQPVDRYGRPVPPNENTPARANLVALMEIGNGKVSRIGRTPFAVMQAVLVDSHVAILPAQENSRVEIHNAADMQRKKTLLATAPLTSISVRDNQLLLHSAQSIEVFSMKTLKRVRSLGNTLPGHPAVRRSSQIATFEDGVIVNGVLHNPTGAEAMLLVSPGLIPVLPSADQKLYNGSFLRRGPVLTTGRADHYSLYRTNGIIAGPAEIPSRRLRVSVEQSVTELRRPGKPSSSSKYKRVLWLIVANQAGGRLARIPILIATTARDNNQFAVRPLIRTHGSDVYIAFGNRIFRWSPDRLEDLPPANAGDVAFHVVPEQQTFELRPARTELRHTVRGGKGPFEFVLFTRLDGVTIGEQSGVVTVDGAKLIDSVVEPLVRLVARTKNGLDLTQQLQALALNVAEPVAKLIGHRPRGYPVAVPIHFKVIDADGLIAEMQYFAIADIPFRTITAKIQARTRELQLQP